MEVEFCLSNMSQTETGNDSQTTRQGDAVETQITERDQYIALFSMLGMRDSESDALQEAIESSNWLDEDVGAPPLWLNGFTYTINQFCPTCSVSLVRLVMAYQGRDAEGFEEEYTKEVFTLFHPDPERMLNDYTPNEILKEAIQGCHLCSMAIGSSWSRGDVPVDTVRWMKNPTWRKRAQMLLYNMYQPRRDQGKDNRWRPLCQIVFGTSLTTQLSPEGDHSGFWRPLHMYTKEGLNLWYQRNEPGFAFSEDDEPPKPPLCASTGEPEVLNIAIWWLQRCLKEHKMCHIAGAHSDSSEKPARLLYVGSAQDNACRLFMNNPEENGKSPPYLTLSYCWGQKGFTRLTNVNLENFIESIDITTLPKTIEDAIHITRRLGYSYIWIDALCIIQDSKKDWATESVKMGSIYRNSQLTIAALGASDSHQGCFMERNPLCFRDIHLPGTDFYISLRAGHAGPLFKREFDVLGLAASPLQGRAWVVQEQVSSPRTLFFGSSGISWQCLECEADESYPPGSKCSEKEPSNLKWLLHRSLLSERIDLVKTWEPILGQFTGCKLTFPSDKLVAISGVANVLSKASNQKYIAGMWIQDLCHGLLWHSKPSDWAGNSVLRRLDNGCPTFSWASVGQGIHYLIMYGDSEINLEATSLSIVVSDPGGDDRIVIRAVAQLKEVILLPPSHHKNGKPRLMLADDGTLPDDYTWDDDKETKAEIIRSMKTLRYDWTIDKKIDEDRDTSSYGPFSYDWTPDIPLDGSITRAWYLCLARIPGFDPAGAAGLIIVPTNTDRSSWNRIGVLTHHGFFKLPPVATALRVTLQRAVDNEIDWEETAKARAANPFLFDPKKPSTEIVLV